MGSVGFQCRVCKPDSWVLEHGGFDRQALKFWRSTEGQRVAKFCSGKLQSCGYRFRAVRRRVVQLDLFGNRAVCQSASLAKVIDDRAASLDMVRELQERRWSIFFPRDRRHDLEPVALAFARDICGLIDTMLPRKPEGQVVTFGGLEHQKITKRVARTSSGQLQSERLALLGELCFQSRL